MEIHNLLFYDMFHRQLGHFRYTPSQAYSRLVLQKNNNPQQKKNTFLELNISFLRRQLVVIEHVLLLFQSSF